MSFTTIPAAGAKLRGSTLSALITETRQASSVLSTGFALATSSTTLQNVTGLAVSVAASTIYSGRLTVCAVNASGNTEDVRYGFSFPSGATLHYFVVGPSTAVTASNGDGEFSAKQSATSGSTVVGVGVVGGGVYTTTHIDVWLETSSNAGTLQVMAAQNTSGGNVVTIGLGSHLLLQQAV